MTKKAIVVLAEGFEEIEAITPIDLLRRAGVTTWAVGIHPGASCVTGSHGIRVGVDTDLENIPDDIDACIFPGGLPGAENLAASVHVRALIQRLHLDKKIIAAICASPAVLLAPLGVLDGKTATCFPGMENTLPKTTRFSPDPVVADGTLVTSRSAGTAVDFSLKIIELLINTQAADSLRAKIMAG